MPMCWWPPTHMPAKIGCYVAQPIIPPELREKPRSPVNSNVRTLHLPSDSPLYSKLRKKTMLNSVKAFIVISALILSGCAATVQRTSVSESPLTVSEAAAKNVVMVVQGSDVASKSDDWEKLRKEWRSAMEGAAEESGSVFSYHDAISELPQKNGTLVVINVNDYRYVSQGARFMVGVMTGNAFIDADVSFFELPTKKPIGTRSYKTSSSAGQGIFSPMTAKQIQGISGEIMRELSQK